MSTRTTNDEDDTRPDGAEQREVCICAAIQLPDGELFRGHRHDDAIQTAGKASVPRADIYEAAQGFITSRNRFVGREEACALHIAAGIPSAQTGQPLKPGMLFSEDLYLRSTKGQTLPAVGGEAGRSAPEPPTDVLLGSQNTPCQHGRLAYMNTTGGAICINCRAYFGLGSPEDQRAEAEWKAEIHAGAAPEPPPSEERETTISRASERSDARARQDLRENLNEKASNDRA